MNSSSNVEFLKKQIVLFSCSDGNGCICSQLPPPLVRKSRLVGNRYSPTFEGQAVDDLPGFIEDMLSGGKGSLGPQSCDDEGAVLDDVAEHLEEGVEVHRVHFVQSDWHS